MDRNNRLYQQVADRLREGLDAGQYAERLPTESELVEHFQVSLTTIKKALSLLVEEGRIVRISGKGTFPVDHQSKEAPSSHGSGLVGFLIPVLPDEFSRRLLKGATERLAEANVHPVIGLTASDSAHEAGVIRRMREMGVDGLIICPIEREIYNEEILRLKLDRFPFVLIDKRLPGIETPFVVGDGPGLIRTAVQHLAELGHQHIALAASSPLPQLTQSLAERIEAFEAAMAEYDLNADAIWTVSESPDATVEAWTGIHEGLKGEVTAVIATTTLDTILIRRAASDLRLKLPEDLSVIGFDYSGVVDAPWEAFSPLPPEETLTWLDQSEEVMGRKAAELILEVMANPLLSPYAIVPGVFHRGGTTAAPRAVHTVSVKAGMPG